MGFQVSIDSAAADSQVVTDRFGGMLAKYYIVDAALLDLSMRGELMHLRNVYTNHNSDFVVCKSCVSQHWISMQCLLHWCVRCCCYTNGYEELVDADTFWNIVIAGGRVRPNKKLNMAVYGPNVNTQDILAGKVLPPVEFQPVYDLLNSFISETAPAPKVERRGSRHGGRGLDDIEASGASGVRMYANQHAGIYWYQTETR